jgi:hypothetical protein
MSLTYVVIFCFEVGGPSLCCRENGAAGAGTREL